MLKLQPKPVSLPTNLYSAAATRELDAQIIAAGTPGLELMQAAAQAVWRELQRRWPTAGRLTVLCGAGNNAGDGYLVACLAKQAGWQVQVVAVSPVQQLQATAAQAWQLAVAAGVEIVAWPTSLPSTGVLVDALLGTGLHSQVKEPFVSAIAAINASPLPCVAVDLPSGLNADTGALAGVGVNADLTITFIALKPGLLTAEGPDLTGELVFAPLAKLPAHTITPVLQRLTLNSCKATLARRPKAAHKGNFGHLVVLGGNKGMGGASILAAATALRAGAGKVSVITRSEHLAPLLARCPEAMAYAVEDPAQAAAVLAQANSVVIGPGLGQDAWAQQLLDLALQQQLPTLLDADALNLLAQQPKHLGEQVVITPHPAEAGRLLGWPTNQVQQDRIAAVKRLAQEFACTAVLKGVGSLVAAATADSPPSLCTYGNPGMATAGMGDVLSGLIGALLAQGLSALAAARYGVLLHALAGDRAAQQEGQLGIVASDLLPQLRHYLNYPLA